MKILPFLVAVVVLVAACAPAPVLRDDSLLHDDSLITGQPCAAPCFRGITPGQTSWTDALTIVNDDTEFSNVQTQGPEGDNPAIQVSWQQGSDAPVCCQMVTQDGESVSLVFLRTAPNHTLGELIGAHGEPTYLAGQSFTDDQAIMSLVYPDVPMVVYAFVAGADTGELAASSEIIGALYIVPDDMDLLIKTTELHGWEGYQSYSAYMDSTLVVTPSVTLTPTAES